MALDEGMWGKAAKTVVVQRPNKVEGFYDVYIHEGEINEISE